MALIQTQFKEINIVATDIPDDAVLAQQQGSGGFLYEQVTGDLLKKIIIAMNKDVRLMSNVGISVVANTPTNGLTIALKQEDGTDPGPLHKNKCVIEFRSSTLTSGSVVFREVTAALSSAISSGSTIGFFAAKAEKLHIYLIDNGGTVKIAYSGSNTFSESDLQTTVAEGGAGAADSKTVLYSDAVYTNVAIRYLGFALLTEATPGTWVTNPSQIVVGMPGRISQNSVVKVTTGNGHGSTDNKVRRFTNVSTTGTAITRASSAGNGDTFTINEDGLYSGVYNDTYSAASEQIGITIDDNALTTSVSAQSSSIVAARGNTGTNAFCTVSFVRRLFVGQIVRCKTQGNADGASSATFFELCKIGD
jgi:hypothetical protein